MKIFKNTTRSIQALMIAGAIDLSCGQAQAALTINGSTFNGYLITPDIITTTQHGTMKFLITNNTSTDVSAQLCMGTELQWQSSVCGKQLTYAKNGPGVAIIDPATLNNQFLYVLKGPNGTTVDFTLTID